MLLAGTTASSIRPRPGAGRTSPIRILVDAILVEINGLRLLAPAAFLANTIDASLVKTFGVLFEAHWMEVSGFRSLDGVLGAASGLCKALNECIYGPNVGDVPTGEV